jgi:hypothetical protein
MYVIQTWVHNGHKYFHDISGGIGGDDPMGGDTDRVLQNMQGNLSHLTQRIPMA